MLSFKINNSPLSLPDDFSFTMNLKSPIFSDVGNYSYPFKIPYTPKAAILMGFRNRVENTGDPYRVDQGSFAWNGIDIFSGSVKMKILNSKRFEGSLYEGNGDFNYNVKNKNLNNFDFGQLSFANEQDALSWINACRNFVYPDRPCAFPEIFNDKYFVDPVYVGMKKLNCYNRNNDLIEALSETNERGAIVPMLYLKYILEKLFRGLGYSLNDSFFITYPSFNKVVMYNSVSCNNEVDGFFPYYLSELLFNYHLPFIKLSDFISGLETMFNIRFFVNNTTRDIRILPIGVVLNNSQYCEFSKNIVSISTELDEQLLGYKLKMEIDGDDTAFDVLNDYEEQLLNNLKGSVERLIDLPVWPAAIPFEIRYVIEAGYYYKMMNKQWVQMASESLDLSTQYIYRDGKESINSKFSTLIMGGDSTFCNCKNQRINYTDIAPRIFFANYGDYGDHQIVMGSNFSPDFGSLFYNGPTGLFEKHFRQYLSWRIQTKHVKIIKQMSATELRDFDFSQKYMINGIKYLVAGIQVVVKKDRILPATLDCYPCS